MSIRSEINRIKGNVANAYAAVEEKGGTLPEKQNSGGLPAAIHSISGGSGGNIELISATIPKGRMKGDVDGDGRITDSDRETILQAVSQNIILDTIGEWAADFNGDGKVKTNDAQALEVYLNGNVNSNLSDYYGNWIYSTGTKTFSCSIASDQFNSGKSAVVFIGGFWEQDMFTAAEMAEGFLKIYTARPPIEDIPCLILLSAGSGEAIIQARTSCAQP